MWLLQFPQFTICQMTNEAELLLLSISFHVSPLNQYLLWFICTILFSLNVSVWKWILLSTFYSAATWNCKICRFFPALYPLFYRSRLRIILLSLPVQIKSHLEQNNGAVCTLWCGFNLALFLKPGKIKASCLEPIGTMNHRQIVQVPAFVNRESIPGNCLFPISTSSHTCCCVCHSSRCVLNVNVIHSIYSWLFSLLVTYQGQCLISDFAFNCP